MLFHDAFLLYTPCLLLLTLLPWVLQNVLLWSQLLHDLPTAVLRLLHSCLGLCMQRPNWARTMCSCSVLCAACCAGRLQVHVLHGFLQTCYPHVAMQRWVAAAAALHVGGLRALAAAGRARRHDCWPLVRW